VNLHIYIARQSTSTANSVKKPTPVYYDTKHHPANIISKQNLLATIFTGKLKKNYYSNSSHYLYNNCSKQQQTNFTKLCI